MKGERGKPIYWCMLFRTNSLLSFLVFLSFFLSFRSNLFFFSSYSVLSFLCCENPLFSDPQYRARQGPLYSAYCDQCFTVLPLNRLCLVWVCLPIVQNPCQTEVDPFCPFCAPRTHFVLLRAAAFPATMLISSLLTLRACTQRFPLKLPLLGGLSSQQDVPPKRGLSRGRK